MANQDILHELWLENNMPKKGVPLREIGEFANRKIGHLKSKRGQITTSGLNYAVLQFILEYCSLSDWHEGLWEEFKKAKNPTKGNYAIWRKHLNISVDIVDKSSVKNFNVPRADTSSTVIQKMVSKKEFLNEDMYEFIEFIKEKIERETILGKKGWLYQLKSYKWPPKKGDYKEGINLRKHFSYIANCAENSTGLGAETFRYGVCNAVAGWAGIPQPVSKEDCSKIFESINYLKGTINNDLIDCNKIFGRRIATSSKLYYFSDPLNWTIYDSRVALTLSQLAYYFKKEKDDIFDRLKDNIIFPMPPTQSTMRKHPFNVNWNEAEASLWFVRASILLKAIAEFLNKECFPSPQDVISSSDSWRLYHVEMVFFRIGERNWENKSQLRTTADKRLRYASPKFV